MGLGFVLLVWTAFFGCSGFPIAGALAFWSWRNGVAIQHPSKMRAAAAALLPFVLLVTGLLWFFSYAFYCTALRHVDPGLGDSWAVPLRHGYFFCMIDVTDSGHLMKDGCTGSPTVHGIRELVEVEDVIVGAGEDGAFTFDMRSDHAERYPDPATALARFEPAPKLQAAEQFYRNRRFAWQDVAALALLVASVVALSWQWFRWFIEERRA